MALGVGAGPSQTARARMAGRTTVGYLFASHERVDNFLEVQGEEKRGQEVVAA